MQNEKTSKVVASKAAKLLSMEKPLGVSNEVWEMVISVAGSCLTQAENKLPKHVSDACATLAMFTATASNTYPQFFIGLPPLPKVKVSLSSKLNKVY